MALLKARPTPVLKLPCVIKVTCTAKGVASQAVGNNLRAEFVIDPDAIANGTRDQLGSTQDRLGSLEYQSVINVCLNFFKARRSSSPLNRLFSVSSSSEGDISDSACGRGSGISECRIEPFSAQRSHRRRANHQVSVCTNSTGNCFSNGNRSSDSDRIPEPGVACR